MKGLIIACIGIHALLFGDKPLVVVSVPPYVEFVTAIAGDHVDVETALPPSFDPHSGETTPQKMAAIGRASVWIGVGEPFEKRLIEAAKRQNPALRVVNLSQGTDLISAGCHHGPDRHIWTSLSLAEGQARRIAEALEPFGPTKLDAYVKRLYIADKEISSLLAPVKGSAVVVAHPSLAYFCRDYGLKELSVECEGKELGPQELTKLLTTIRQQERLCFLTQPQFSRKGIDLLAKQVGCTPRAVDPLRPDYIESMRDVARAIVEGQCHP